MRTAATIGVYGWAVAAFLDALLAADVRRVLDVRQRRGVRGSEYAWANAQRLQAALAAAIAAELPPEGAAALMCVERDPEACHRSLIAERLAAEYGLNVVHLRR